MHVLVCAYIEHIYIYIYTVDGVTGLNDSRAPSCGRRSARCNYIANECMRAQFPKPGHGEPAVLHI